jgi:hypothetical protein
MLDDSYQQFIHDFLLDSTQMLDTSNFQNMVNDLDEGLTLPYLEQDIPDVCLDEQDINDLDNDDFSENMPLDSQNTQLAPQSDMNKILSDTRFECQNLRNLNEQLLEQVQSANQRIAYYELEVQRKDLEANLAIEQQKQLIIESEALKQDELKAEIHRLNQLLSQSQSSQQEISNIRLTLEKEKELDLLSMKRDLMTQKENQLNDIRLEMIQQKNDMKQVFEIELQSERTNSREKREELENEITELKQSLLNVADVSIKVQAATQTEAQSNMYIPQKYFKEIKSRIGIKLNEEKDLFTLGDLINILEQAKIQKENEHAAFEQKIQTLQLDIEKQAAMNNEKLASEKKTLESLHLEAIKTIKMSHKSEMQHLAMTLDLKDGHLERMRSVNALQKPLNLAELKLAYGDILQQFEQEILQKTTAGREKAFSEEILELSKSVRTQAQELKEMDKDCKARILKISDDYERKKQKLEQNYKTELYNVTTKLKEQCSIAYENAANKLKEEYLSRESKNNDEHYKSRIKELEVVDCDIEICKNEERRSSTGAVKSQAKLYINLEKDARRSC